MDLCFLIPSKMRRQVLEYFVDDPNAQVYVRELARELKAAPQLVYRELINLENWGFLFSSAQGNQRIFRLNKKFPFFSAIQEIFKLNQKLQNPEFEIVKTYNLEKLSKELQKIPVPNELIPGLTAKRKKPRAFAEEKILKKYK